MDARRKIDETSLPEEIAAIGSSHRRAATRGGAGRSSAGRSSAAEGGRRGEQAAAIDEIFMVILEIVGFVSMLLGDVGCAHGSRLISQLDRT